MWRLALIDPPLANEVRHAAVAAGVALDLDLRKQRFGSAPILLVTVGIGLKRQNQHHMKRAQLDRLSGTLVGRHRPLVRLPEPPPERVSRQAGLPGNRM